MPTENKIKAQKIYEGGVRYMNNAHKELQLADKNGKVYRDVKHLRTACGIAYIGMLKAIDGIFLLRNIPKPKKRASIEYYQQNLSQIDKKTLTSLNSAYEILHLYGYYDGFNDIRVIKIGFEEAHYIINKLKQSILNQTIMKNKFFILSAALALATSISFAQVPNLPGSGNALSFNGTSDYVQISEINLNYVTVEAWVKPTSYSAVPSLGICQSYGAETSDYGGFRLSLNGTGEPSGWVGVTSTSVFVVNAPAPLILNQWAHVAFTFDGILLNIYVNGILSNTLTTPASTIRNPTIAQNFIGSGKTWSGAPGFFFPGSIDEVRIWNIARTQTEIRNTMCQKLVGNEAGLVGYWRFDESSGTTIFDSAPLGGNNNGTLK